MGGESTQSTTQASTTNPWDKAQPMLQSILGQLQGNLGNTGVTGAENSALTGSTNNANNFASTYGPQAMDYAKSLFSGGGALNQAGNVNQNYQNYYNQTNPLASNTNYNPMQTPGIGQQLQTLQSDITGNINGSFAAGGRDFSPANSQALARGLSQGLAPVLTNQYNQNVQNQQGAASNLFGAGNTTTGALAGMQQNYLANQGQGTAAAGQGLNVQNAGNDAIMQAEAARRGIPVQALGLIAQMGIPIAGLGSQSTGQSQGTQQMSGAQQFGTIASGIGNILGGAGNFMKYMPSDRKLKEDIAQVGALFDGTPVYRYRYIGQPAFQIGLMAQDVEKTTPGAVIEINGYKAVDYRAATEASREMKAA